MTNQARILGALRGYLQDSTRIAMSGVGTDELSYYPALNSLLDQLGRELCPPVTTIPNPAARDGDFPDIALYEDESQVLVLPIEVKPATLSREDLMRLPQAVRYATSFGGGSVLLCNLAEFIWAELDANGELALRDYVVVCDREAFGSRSAQVDSHCPDKLTELLEAATARRSVLKEPSRIAALLAYHARLMADSIRESGDPKELLQPLADGLRDGLGMHLEDEFFVPTVVQTLTYGLFAAWLESPNPQEFDHRDAQELLRARVIAELFHQLLQPSFLRRCNLRPRMEAISRTLQWVDWEEFVGKFSNYAIEYFYEPFLAKFDPHLRDKLGVWYTPPEIAAYQVRRVDKQLRDVLGLEGGLSDESVIILDPAVGTGTYLKAVLNHLYEKCIEHGEPPAIAAAATKHAALSRVIGFEVLPAAFVIGHLHLEHFLSDKGAPLGENERLRLYLANSLIGWGVGAIRSIPPLPGLEDELAAASRVKSEEPVLVILGNPPYEGYSPADSEEERALLDPWIEPLWREWGLRKHRLGDLYVRFWRIGVRKIAEMTNRGVLCYITNRKWLGGRSFPAMRQDIVRSFGDIVVDDLHGDVHDTTHPGDGSIFTTSTMPGIQRGVAIATLTRTGAESGVAEVRLRDFWGSGASKRERLDSLRDLGIDEDLVDHVPTKQKRWKLVADTSGDDPALDEYFSFLVSGVQPVREEAVCDRVKESLEARMSDYFDDGLSTEDLIETYPAFGVTRSRYNPQVVREKLLTDREFDRSKVVEFLFKPLDKRYLYWETKHKLLNEARSQLFPYFFRKEGESWARIEGQCALVASQTPRRPGAARPTVTTGVPGFHAMDPDARVLPRLSPDDPSGGPGTFQFGESGMTTNISASWVSAARSIGISGDDREVGDTLFFALVAISQAPGWIDSIGTDVDDFPGVPLPSEPNLLRGCADIGHQIAQLFDPFARVVGVTAGRISPELSGLAIPDATSARELSSGNTRHGGAYRAEGSGAIFWDSEHAWRSVPREVWEFSVGGFQVLPKWLSYRHSRHGYVMSDADVRAVTHICRRIAAILALASTCQEFYELAAASPLEDASDGSAATDGPD